MSLKRSVKSQYSVYLHKLYERDNLKQHAQEILGSNMEWTQVNSTQSDHWVQARRYLYGTTQTWRALSGSFMQTGIEIFERSFPMFLHSRLQTLTSDSTFGIGSLDRRRMWNRLKWSWPSSSTGHKQRLHDNMHTCCEFSTDTTHRFYGFRSML